MCNNEQLQQQQEHSRKTFAQNRMDFFDLVPGEKKKRKCVWKYHFTVFITQNHDPYGRWPLATCVYLGRFWMTVINIARCTIPTSILFTTRSKSVAILFRHAFITMPVIRAYLVSSINCTFWVERVRLRLRKYECNENPIAFEIGFTDVNGCTRKRDCE